MNLPKSSRYHRGRRRAGAAAALASIAFLTLLLATGGSVRLRSVVGGSAAGYAAIVVLALAIVQSPFAWYRGCRLERTYELSRIRFRDWAAGYCKTTALALVVAAGLSELVYRSMQWPAWWLIASAGSVAALTLLTVAGPLLLLPALRRSRPVARDPLQARLQRLSARAGVPVLGVHQLPLGDGTRRTSAALVGAGATRRILLSDTLLASYSDDEIEVVMAHEIGHHVHRDLLKAGVVEALLLLIGFRAAAGVLEASWQGLGLTSTADVAGLPAIGMTVGAVLVAATPLLNWWSRAHERRADRFALQHASHPNAFIDAVRRMSAQNLSEDRPSGPAFLWFHTHPTPEERIAAAREVLGRRDLKAG